MLFSLVFVYAEPRRDHQNPRRQVSRPLVLPALLPPSRLSHSFITSLLHYFLLDRHRDEKPLVATPLVPADCKCPLPQPLSLHILTNAPGVWGATLPLLKSYLNSPSAPNALFRGVYHQFPFWFTQRHAEGLAQRMLEGLTQLAPSLRRAFVAKGAQKARSQRLKTANPPDLGASGRIVESMGATRFRRKLSRPEGMPGPTCP
jgi:hypothetical protein